MIKLDDNLLVEMGLQDLPREEKAGFLKHMYETLEMRVGTRLAERMSDQQMSDFEQFIGGNTAFATQQLDVMKAGWRDSDEYRDQMQKGQQAGRTEPEVIAEFAAFTWLETNFPDYKDVVASEFEKLKGEIAPLAAHILAASQDQSQGAVVQAPQAPPVAGPVNPAQADYAQPAQYDGVSGIQENYNQQPHPTPPQQHPQQPMPPQNPPAVG